MAMDMHTSTNQGMDLGNDGQDRGLRDLLSAAECVLNNDIARAEGVVEQGASSFHQLGRGLLVLLKTSLGFEGAWAKHAARALMDAETTAAVEAAEARARALAQVATDNKTERVFYPGASTELCAAQARLASATVATLSQSMLEYMRGLYKVRQSYVALRKLAEHERRRVRALKTTGGSAVIQPRSGSGSGNGFLHSPDEVEADEVYDIRTPEMMSPSDQYTYTGTYLCFGIMLVMLGMIPSAFQYVLRVVGFRGDKERGMAMLWEATKFHDAHGALAALLILSLYSAVRAACDIVDGESHPKQRCADLVAEMTARYPDSVFWTLERGRVAAAHGDLDRAIGILETPLDGAPRPLVALTLKEKTMYQMISHDYAACTEGFVAYTNETKYLHAMYYYNAGCAQIELYRALKTSDPTQAQIHKERARTYLETATVGVDRKKLMASELPFDTFVTRKLKKWRARAEQLDIDLVDAAGPSPIEEMIYYYGGHKWMNASELEQSLTAIGKCKTSARWENEAVDERSIYALLTGVVLRSQGKLDEAKTQFTQVLAQDRREFQGPLNDNWVQPSAYYEMAIVAWLEKGLDGNDEAAKLDECAKQLDRVARWGSYELDIRLTVRVKAAQDVVNKARAARK